MKKYERHLLIGTFLSFLGILGLYKFGIWAFLCWGLIIFGKILVILSIMEYKDYKRLLRGEDLNDDFWLIKKAREIRKRYY